MKFSINYNVIFLHIILIFFSTDLHSQTINIISWNIQDCGRTKDDSEILFIAQTVKDADLIAIQEVVAVDPAGAQAIGRLADQLNRIGSRWDYRISDPTNSPVSGQSERYAFIWKTSKLDMIHHPFLDSLLNEQIIREPFISRFRIRANKKEFIVVNFHSRRFDQQPEEEVKHFYTYPERFDVPVVIAGDFNMSSEHPVFGGLYSQGYYPAIVNKKTTLKKACDNGVYLNHPIDNIFIPTGICLEYAQVLDFVKNCTSLDSARMISDHLPVLSKVSY